MNPRSLRDSDAAPNTSAATRKNNDHKLSTKLTSWRITLATHDTTPIASIANKAMT